MHIALDASKHFIQSLQNCFIMETKQVSKLPEAYQLLVQVRSWSNAISRDGESYLRLEVVTYSVKKLSTKEFISLDNVPFRIDVLHISSKIQSMVKGKLSAESVLFIIVEECIANETHYIADEVSSEVIVHTKNFILVRKVFQAMKSEMAVIYELGIINKTIYNILIESINQNILFSRFN